MPADHRLTLDKFKKNYTKQVSELRPRGRRIAPLCGRGDAGRAVAGGEAEWNDEKMGARFASEPVHGPFVCWPIRSTPWMRRPGVYRAQVKNPLREHSGFAVAPYLMSACRKSSFQVCPERTSVNMNADRKASVPLFWSAAFCAVCATKEPAQRRALEGRSSENRHHTIEATLAGRTMRSHQTAEGMENCRAGQGVALEMPRP